MGDHDNHYKVPTRSPYERWSPDPYSIDPIDRRPGIIIEPFNFSLEDNCSIFSHQGKNLDELDIANQVRIFFGGFGKVHASGRRFFQPRPAEAELFWMPFFRNGEGSVWVRGLTLFTNATANWRWLEWEDSSAAADGFGDTQNFSQFMLGLRWNLFTNDGNGVLSRQ